MKHAFFVIARIDDTFHQDNVASTVGRAPGSSKDVLKRCLSSIRKYHPDSPVYVIDSNSPDQNYHEEIERDFSAKVDYAKNCNYAVGAIKHAYENYPDVDFYLFVQDSQELRSSLSDRMNYDISVCNFFLSHKGLHRSRPGRGYGFGHQWHIDKGDVWLKKFTSIDQIPDTFTGCWACIIYCKREVLEKLDVAGYFKMLPSNKGEDQMTERLTGIVLESLGYNISLNSLDSKRIHKNFRGRS